MFLCICLCGRSSTLCWWYVNILGWAWFSFWGKKLHKTGKNHTPKRAPPYYSWHSQHALLWLGSMPRNTRGFTSKEVWYRSCSHVLTDADKTKNIHSVIQTSKEMFPCKRQLVNVNLSLKMSWCKFQFCSFILIWYLLQKRPIIYIIYSIMLLHFCKNV